MSGKHVFHDEAFHYHNNEERHKICILCATIYHIANINKLNMECPGYVPEYKEHHRKWYEENVGPFPPGSKSHNNGFKVTSLF